jgi:hypothetical protein
LNLIKVIKYITKAENDSFLYFTIENYEKYKWIIYPLVFFNREYRACKIFRKEFKYHRNIVVVALRYHGRVVKRRTNGFAKEFISEHKDPKCPYCKTKLTEKNATADHIITVAKGGNNSKINLLACCEDCNVERGHTDFYRYLFAKRPDLKDKKYPFI